MADIESSVVITKDKLGGKMGYDSHNDRGGDGYRGGRGGGSRNNRDRGDEVFSKRIPAGKRTYFFDVKSTRSGDDYFITITESKRVDDGRYEKHKIFLYKEDFGKFLSAAHEVVQHVQEECLPDYDFKDVPEYIPVERDDYDDDEDFNE